MEEGVRRSTGHPCRFGDTPGRDFIIVVYEGIDAGSVYPITAHEVPAL